jgi:hypothetical protein
MIGARVPKANRSAGTSVRSGILKGGSTQEARSGGCRAHRGRAAGQIFGTRIVLIIALPLSA